jgi:ATP-dependent Clp protease ATP-binding subunit ClpC
MEAKFSPRVKDVLSFSREEALRLGNDFIGVEHFLLGILREGEGNAVRILKGFNLDMGQLKAEVERQLSETAKSSVAPGANIPLRQNYLKVRSSERNICYFRC